MPKHYVFFIFSLNGGGSAKIILRLAERASEKSKVTLVTTEEPNGAYQIPAQIRVCVLSRNQFQIFPKNINAYISIFFGLRRFLKYNPADNFISFIHIANIVGTLASIGIAKKIIVCERSDLQKTRIKKAWKVIRPWVYRFADQIILQNVSDRVNLPNYLQSKITVAPNPMKDYKFSMPVERRNRLVSVGRLHPVKRYELLLEIVEPILKSNSNFELWICGEGKEKNKLEILIRKLELEGQVKLTGHLENVEEVVNSSKIFLMTSESEGQPNALIEAALHGLSVICFDTSPCFKELKEEFPQIKTIQDGDIEAFRTTLSELIIKKETFTYSEQIEKLDRWNEKAFYQWDMIIYE
ncbi:MAG: glycosyltransferase [Bdellovibrionota bacterium]